MWLGFCSVKAEMRGRHVETRVTVKNRAYGRKKGGKTEWGEEGRKREEEDVDEKEEKEQRHTHTV